MKNSALISVFAALWILACSQKNHDLTSDAGTLAYGKQLLEDEFFEEARTQFNRLKTEFPQSPLLVETDLMIAETYYRDESYQAAASALEDFIRTYPGRPEVPDALYKLGMSYAKQMPSSPQRDARATQKAVQTFSRLISTFPNSEHVTEAHERVKEARTLLANKVYRIGRFYEGQKDYAASARRYAELVSLYSDLEIAEEAFARRVRMTNLAGEKDAATALAAEFLSRYPDSKHKALVEIEK